MSTPAGYKWLDTVGALPRTIAEGLALVGTAEVVGKGSSRTILSWRDEINAAAGVNPLARPVAGYSDDDIPWCGLFAAIVSLRAGKQVVDSPLWARNWAKFGVKAGKPSLGDVLVFGRDGGGHVGFYVAEDNDAYHVLGGNQGNRVSITRVAKSRCLAARRPVYRQQPASVRPYRVATGGALSKNEA